MSKDEKEYEGNSWRMIDESKVTKGFVWLTRNANIAMQEMRILEEI